MARKISAKKLLNYLINFWRRGLVVILLGFLSLVIYSLFFSLQSIAAETIVVRYGILEQSLPIVDLENYAATKQVSASLKDFLRFLDAKEQAKVQEALQVKLALDIVALDKLLDTETGQKLLTAISPMIARRDDAGIPALRAAVVLGTKSPEGLGIISFLKAYPSKRIIFNLPETLEVLNNLSLSGGDNSVPPKDNLSSTLFWQTAVQYQSLATQGRQYQACLFGDSITAELGTSLGEKIYNFALDGLSTISLVEQLQRLIPANVQCQKAVIAIGGNDAWYGMSDQLFKEKLTTAIGLVKNLKPQQVFLIPAFYSTVAASFDPTIAAPLKRVEEINVLINQIAAIEKVSVEARDIQLLYENNVLKENLTTDGDHLNSAGLEIYRKALLNILQATP